MRTAIRNAVPSTLQVLEYMHSDLEAVIKDQNLVLGAADVKAYMRMLLTALATCHSKCVTGMGAGDQWLAFGV